MNILGAPIEDSKTKWKHAHSNQKGLNEKDPFINDVLDPVLLGKPLSFEVAKA